MKLLVLGASRRTGRHVVEQGLSRGHDITAFVSDPGTAPLTNRLTPIKGTPTYSAEPARAADGIDAIIATLNNPRTSDAPWSRPLTTEKVRTKVAQNIASLGKARAVFLSAIGIGDSLDDTALFMRMMIRRSTVARFMLDCVENGTHIRETPVVSE